jgi:hypothetical protein
MDLDEFWYGRPAACVIAQQYSSTTVLSFRSHSLGKKKLDGHFKMLPFQCFLLFYVCRCEVAQVRDCSATSSSQHVRNTPCTDNIQFHFSVFTNSLPIARRT